jgi:uncharacterized membrane protein YbjE (DUF340 family)
MAMLWISTKNIVYFLRQTNVKYLQVQLRLLIQIIYFIVMNVSKETPYNFAVDRNKLRRIIISAMYAIITKNNSGILYTLYSVKKIKVHLSESHISQPQSQISMLWLSEKFSIISKQK